MRTTIFTAQDGRVSVVFLPGSPHDWHAVEEDTLLSVCLIKQD